MTPDYDEIKILGKTEDDSHTTDWAKFYQIFLTNLMLLLSVGLFHSDKAVPGLIVLALYVITLIVVVHQDHD